jgi:hypothetical protein
MLRTAPLPLSWTGQNPPPARLHRGGHEPRPSRRMAPGQTSSSNTTIKTHCAGSNRRMTLISGSDQQYQPLCPRPGHRGQLPTPGSHRTWRAVFASLHLRCPAPRSSTGGSQHFAAIRSRFVSTVSFILSLHRGLSLPLHGARVAPERVICRQPLPPVNGSPVLRVLSTGLTSARPSDRPCLGGLSGPTG